MMDRLASAWDRLALRERALVASLFLVFIPVALAFLVALPLLDARDQAQRQRAEAAALYEWVVQRDAEWQSRAPASAEIQQAASPVGIAGIEAALSEDGLRAAVSSLETGQDGRIKMQLEGAGFADFARFLERAGPELGYKIDNLRIAPGRVAGTIAAQLEVAPLQ